MVLNTMSYSQAAVLAVQRGARMVRVHDVKEAVECVRLVGELEKYN